MVRITTFVTVLSLNVMLMACHSNQNTNSDKKLNNDQNIKTTNQKLQQSYQIEKLTTFDEPWAMTALSDGRLLITEKKGQLKLYNPATNKSLNVTGVPRVAYGDQGGLGDISIHPDFQQNGWVYLSYAEEKNKLYGAVVVRARLDLKDPQHPKLMNIERIWEQVPKVSGQGHFAHRIVFDRKGDLWISSGERQKFEPAQDLNSNLGKIVHLYDDGRPQENNPFYQQGGISAQIWSLGHRNPLGLAFDSKDQLWVVEMGPEGGDELNLIQKGHNYGYPLVSNGDHYDGTPIPKHATRPEFTAPKLDWTPVISPSSLIFYQSDALPLWKNKAIIGGLSSKSIVVVDTESNPVREIQRLEMDVRIRALNEAADGSIWGLEDGRNGNLFKIVAN